MTLLDACREVMDDPAIQSHYPDGLSSVDVLMEIRRKHPGGFPLCTVIDVADEMRAFYGRGRS